MAAWRRSRVPASSGYGPWFGSVPDFGESEKGVKFADVTEGSPAAQAGFKGGDILTEFDGKPIQNLYDFTYALRAHKPGDKVKVKVLRNGQPIRGRRDAAATQLMESFGDSLISRDPALRGGRPIIAGTGVSVRAIAVQSNSGLSPEEIAADRTELSLAQVFAALAYYYANKAEIDDDIDAENRAYDDGAASSIRSPTST